jgi:hypothetical protein
MIQDENMGPGRAYRGGFIPVKQRCCSLPCGLFDFTADLLTGESKRVGVNLVFAFVNTHFPKAMYVCEAALGAGQSEILVSAGVAPAQRWTYVGADGLIVYEVPKFLRKIKKAESSAVGLPPVGHCKRSRIERLKVFAHPSKKR